jgi:small-conductance mechanosensitive channel
MIGDDDIYEKNIQMGSAGLFNWTVYKNGTTDYVVTVSAEGFEAWKQSINPSFFIIDDTSPHEIVTLSANIPSFPELDQRKATISFTFRPINSSKTFVITRNAVINVYSNGQANETNTILGLFENPFPSPLNTSLGAFLLNLFLWAVIAVLIYIFIKQFLIGIAKKTETLLDDTLIEIIRWPILFIIILYGSVQSILELDINLGLKLTLQQFSLLIFSIIGIYMAYRIFDEILEEITKIKGGKTTIFGAVLRPVFRKIGILSIIIGGLIFALHAIGIQITALLAGAGVIGLVVAFAAQDTLSNFFSGIHLLLDRPFKIGDVIYLETGEYCRVENVGMRSTKLYSIFDHELIILPNNAVANQKIINIVKPDVKIRKKIEVCVAYGSDIEKVKYILHQAAVDHPNVVNETGFEPEVRFTNFGDSGLDFLIYLWIDEVMNQWGVLSDVRSDIDHRFREEHITIPFPQRTVWLNMVKSEKKKANAVKKGKKDNTKISSK